MRRAAYVGASVAASAAVILRAFHERPNFYSAAVYLGQSTACRMILLNMLLLTLGSSIYGLQRLLYGPLRAIEIEQLWDKAWYAITETALAMTTFRDEVGGYFFLMFMTLLAGKVWGWIGEGRVETLEQQPPANPKTFHARLIASLFLSEAFDLLMLRYCLRTILDQNPPRAGMMVMFVFEFAILAINSTSTLARYGLALNERYVIHTQTKVKVEERKEEIRVERERDRQQEIANAAPGHTVPPPAPVTDDEVDENEIDVPGWQEKGKYILFLDLLTDLLKLVFYMGFFLILIVFAGIPIHMFRDLYLTTRSFLKRINDYVKYRNATRDMNTRYPDATAEELARDGTCIICREDMQPWQEAPGQAANQGRAQRAPPDERRRPKKLPCGHILHVGCLRSWLERQQVCPTCRRSVLEPTPTSTSNRPAQGQNGPGQGQVQGHNANHNPGGQAPPADANGGQAPRHDANRPFNGVEGIRARTFNLGGMRLTFATGNARQFRNAINNMRDNDGGGSSSSTAAIGSSSAGGSAGSLHEQLQATEREIISQINQLNATREQLTTVRALEAELVRLRQMQAAGSSSAPAGVATTDAIQRPLPMAAIPASAPVVMPFGGSSFQQQVLGSQPQQGPLTAGSSELPSGLTLPEGWSALPLQRMGTETQLGATVDSSQVVSQAPFRQSSRSTSVGPTHHARSISRGSRAGTPQPVHPSALTAALAQSVRTATEAFTSTPPEPANGMAAAAAPVTSQAVENGNEQATNNSNDDEPQLISGLPDWSNAGVGGASSPEAAPATTNGDAPADTNGGVASSAADAQQDGESNHGDKGKGRAATVEEAPDPEA